MTDRTKDDEGEKKYEKVKKKGAQTVGERGNRKVLQCADRVVEGRADIKRRSSGSTTRT